jgi:hypothetical protein
MHFLGWPGTWVLCTPKEAKCPYWPWDPTQPSLHRGQGLFLHRYSSMDKSLTTSLRVVITLSGGVYPLPPPYAFLVCTETTNITITVCAESPLIADITQPGLLIMHPRAVQKESSHFKYLKNLLHGLDVTWLPVIGDLTVHPWTVTLPWD